MNILKILSIILLSLTISVGCYGQNTSANKESRMSSLYDLPPFERAICCIKFYEGLHRKKDYPYVGYGHKLLPGEHYSSNMSATEAEILLRKDMRRLCEFFRGYGKDSLLLAALAYNVGPYKVIGNKHFPKSNVVKKIEAGVRTFQKDYLEFCLWKGRKIDSIKRRRYVELLLLYKA